MMGPHVLFPQPVPFVGRLQGGLTARKTVIIKGYVLPTGKRYRTETEGGSPVPLLPQTQESSPQPLPSLGSQVLSPRLTPIFHSVPSFAINFKVGSTGDLALHINPRMNENAVVRNSYLNGSWGSEERKLSYNPFGCGQFFDVSLDLFPPFLQSLHRGPGLMPTPVPTALHSLWHRSLQGLRQRPAPLRLLPSPFGLPEGGHAGDPG